MIRKVYLDFIHNKISERQLRWLSQSSIKFVLIHLSYLLKKPLCGPILGSLIVNYQCNCRCLMCDMPLKDGKLRENGFEELGTEQMLSILDQFKSLNILGVGFTGGEPLMRPDIIDLIKHCKSLGLLTHLNTNGTLLDRDLSSTLINIGLDSINISLDGSHPYTHDRIRGVPGTWNKAVSALETITAIKRDRGIGPRVKVVMVVGNKNAAEIPEVARLAADLGADCVEFVPEQPFNGKTRATPKWYEKAANSLDQSFRELENLNSNIKLENSQRMMNLLSWTFKGESSPICCYAGFNSLVVDCFGLIYPCHPWANWSKAVGTLGDSTLKEFWDGTHYNKIREDVSNCRECTLNCQVELNLLFQMFRKVPRFHLS